MNSRLIQWTVFHPSSTRLIKISTLNLLMKNYSKPLSSSLSHDHVHWWWWYCRESDTKNKNSLLCTRGAKGKAVGSKKGKASASPSTPAPPDAQADKVCKGANVFKDGADPVLKEDSEYPDWLWELAEPKKSYQDLSSDSTEYWRRLRKQKAHERNVLMKQMGRI